jgi:hypothetical protein
MGEVTMFGFGTTHTDGHSMKEPMIVIRRRSSLALAAVMGGIGSAGIAAPVHAHPGHGHPAVRDGLGHALTSPVHFAPWMLLAGSLIGLLWCFVRVRQWRSTSSSNACSPERVS